MKKTAKLLGILLALSLVLSSLTLVAGALTVDTNTTWDFAIGGQNNPFTIYDHPHGGPDTHLAGDGREANFASKTASTASYTLGNLTLANKMNLVFFTAPVDGVYSYMLNCTGNGNAGNCNIYYFVGNDTDGYTILKYGDAVIRHDPQSGTQTIFTLDIALKQGDSFVIGIGNWYGAELTITRFTVGYTAEHLYSGGECVLCGEAGWSYSLDSASGFTTYDHPHGGAEANLAGDGREANFASKSASTASISNGWFVVAQQKMSLVYFTAPECGDYALDLQVTGNDNAGNCNIFYFVGNDTDGYTVLKNGETAIRHDPGHNIKRDFAINVHLDKGDSLVIAIGNYWGAQLQFHAFNVTRTSVVHTGGTATCKTKAVCEACGESYGDLDPANHESTETSYVKDNDSHSTVYDCCQGTATQDTAHDFTNGNCVCGQEKPACAHTGGNATCEDKAVCDNCGEEYGDLADCNFVDGACTVCGEADPNYVPPTPPAPSTSDFAVATVIVSVVAALGLALVSKRRH